jgi:hypothetical protein
MIEFVATNEQVSPTHRQVNSSVVSSTVQYQGPSSAPTQPVAAYRVSAHSQPPTPTGLRAGPGQFITQVTEETQVIHIPPQSQSQQQNEVTYTIQDKKPKFEPVSFQVSTMKENVQPTQQDGGDPNPFKIFGAKLRSRPNQGIVPSYDDQTMTTSSYSQQQQQPSSLPPKQPNFSKIRQ